MRTVFVAFVSLVLLGSITDYALGSEEHTNEWAAEIPGGSRRAREVAEEHGFTLVREMHNLADHYILHRRDTPHRSKRSANHHTRKLEEDHRVVFAQQQQAKQRDKREVNGGRTLARAIVMTDRGIPDDPNYTDEWYIYTSSESMKRNNVKRADLRVREVWKMGYTGKGSVATVLDDGLEIGHPDLELNYDPYASYDFNDNDPDPSPRYDPTNENKHGTRCAGEIAMVANNLNCGVGVAFDAKVGGVRMLDGTVTDRLESEALTFNSSHVDIYSVSWGPTDDGTKLEGPGFLAHKAILQGIQEGRGGLGSLFVWASGNGGRLGDTCNADGYSSSIHTIAISSSSQDGVSPWYSEKCSSTLATAYSSGTNNEQKVTTTDLHNKCTDQHSGTSAAAPLAAGILALLLEANGNLTWRDVQHIIAHTSRKGPLANEDGWYTNGAGYCVNMMFGFGLLDALGMVQLGHKDNWKPVGEQHICRVEAEDMDQFPVTLESGQMVEVEFNTTACQDQDNEVNFLEHVVLNLDLSYPYRGRISAELESPQGTIVTLMTERYHDRSDKGFNTWPLMSVHTWGEQPQGTWKFRVMDRNGNGNLTGLLENTTLVLYGTKDQPEYQKNDDRRCGDDGTSEATAEEDIEALPEQADDNTVEIFSSGLNGDSVVSLQDTLRQALLLEEEMEAEKARKSQESSFFDFFHF